MRLPQYPSRLGDTGAIAACSLARAGDEPLAPPRTAEQAALELSFEDITREIEENRPGTPGRRADVGFLDRLGNGPGVDDELRPFHQRPKDRDVVGGLGIVLVEIGETVVAGDRDDRARVAEGAADAGYHVGRPGTGGGKAHAGIYGQPADRVGHAGGSALVTRGDETDRIGVAQRVGDRQRLAAGHAEDEAHAERLQRLHDQLATRHAAFAAGCGVTVFGHVSALQMHGQLELGARPAPRKFDAHVALVHGQPLGLKHR